MGAPRKFPHEQAVKFRERGWTWQRIAERYGVTNSAIALAVRKLTDPEYAQRKKDYNRQWQRDHKWKLCMDCGIPIWDTAPGRKRCAPCNGIHHRTTIRKTTLRCSECRRWKLDAEFPHCRNLPARRFRHGVCRGCQATARQRAREARRVPCKRCGKPRINPADRGSGRFLPDSGLCRTCWLEAQKGR